jgi:hypothetical protein
MTEKQSTKTFAICVRNHGYEVSLEKRKIYRLVPDKVASRRGLVRIIDESRESYLYPENCFVAVKLPRVVLKALDLAA